MALKLPPALMSLAGALVALVFRCWTLTLRYEHHGMQAVHDAKGDGRYVFAIWHDELFAMTAQCKLYPMVTIVSQSSDGEILAQVLKRLGMVCARGSSSRGGLKALVGAVREMRDNGREAVITVDGPRGPRHVVKEGVIYLAHKTGARLVPVRAFMSRAHVFEKAWDRFQLPWPFSRVRYEWGEPFAVTGDTLDADALKRETQRLKERLDALG